jgi:hypothetical protein
MNRHQAIRIGGVFMLFAVLAAHGAFAPPTPDQVTAAAAAPAANMAALLKDASAAQAAGVVREVLEEVIGLNLPGDQRDARLAAVVRGALEALPANLREAFASALGGALAGSTAVCGTPGALAAVRNAMAAAGGGGELGAQLVASFNQSFQPGGGAPPPVPHPKPPSPAPPYQGQTIR